ncbi:M15 family metallopeptidase [Kribbella catacumbae]|uniref:M15 family metallopeptidase n=1 Tax=Kribbella catacumbae TaxID=460086 RepID=UPI00039FB2FF|nr:M15 family metallopeptidase [Kribbella catacumbae]
MTQTATARRTTRRTLKPYAVGLVVVTAAIIGVVHQTSALSFSDVLRSDPGTTATEKDGVLPASVTVFDDRHPGVANLDTDLLKALREAATDASANGIKFYVNSGWRSPAYQTQLLRETVAKRGSEEEAARWVATPDKSAHVAGKAVDIGRSDATAWLSEHGAKYGLCQIYANEPWHYELRPEAVEHGCPAMYPDPTHDPRMQH